MKQQAQIVGWAHSPFGKLDAIDIVTLMGGVIGRLFREFGVTISTALVISAAVSLFITPMMCARLLSDERNHEHGRLYQWSERGFEAILGVYERTLKIALHHRFVTLMVMFGTVVLTGYLYYVIPKGFFPLQDTGMLFGITEAAQDISFPAMVERQQALMNIDASMIAPIRRTSGVQTSGNARANSTAPAARM